MMSSGFLAKNGFWLANEIIFTISWEFHPHFLEHDLNDIRNTGNFRDFIEMNQFVDVISDFPVVTHDSLLRP